MSITTCPLCNSGSVAPFLTAEDYTVSHKNFTVFSCSHCSGKFTGNAPAEGEIGPFYSAASYISHSDTQQGLMNRLYHFVRRHTLTEKRKLIGRLSRKSSGTFLDIGAGTGAMLNTMRKAGWQVTGLEPDAAARENALRITGESLLPSAELFALPGNSFDVVTMWHVLEHVHDLHGYLVQIEKLLKADGLLLIAVPNHTSFDAEYYGKHWAAWDVPRHLYHFSPASMRTLINAHGFVNDQVLPMWFDSFYVSMLSETYKTGRQNYLRALWTGLRSNFSALLHNEKCSSLIYVVRKSPTTLS